MKYKTLQPSASLPPVITGGWMAKQTPERRLTALVTVAADRAAIDRLTHKQLATLAGLSVGQFREARRQHGAPIRSKRAATRQAPTLDNINIVDVSASARSPRWGNWLRAPTPMLNNVDIVNVLRQLGSDGLLKLAELVERDQLARTVAPAKTNGGAALDGTR